MFRYRIVIQKARKITCPVGEKYLPNWENKKASERERWSTEKQDNSHDSHSKAFQKNKSNETKTPSLETSRFAKYFF